MSYNALKILHLFFVIGWLAGLFYLPRIFVNHAVTADAATCERLSMMETKLYRFMTLVGILAIAFGLLLWLSFWPAKTIWLHIKVTLVVGLAAYHLYCGRLVRDFAAGRNRHSHTWYRVFNEVPVLVVFAILVLVITMPF